MKISRKLYIVVFTLIACYLFTLPGYSQTTDIYCSTDVPVDIGPSPETVTSDLTVPDSGEIIDVILKLQIDHTWIGDLTISLESPNLTTALLVNQVDAASDDFGTLCDPMPNFILDDSSGVSVATYVGPAAGTFFPVPDPLSTFDTEEQLGTWTLIVEDGFFGDGGALNCWCLEITRITPQLSIALSPPLATNNVGTSHTVTALVVDNSGVPQVGLTVQFSVISGPNAGLVSIPNNGECSINDNCTTDGNGQVSWTYSSPNPGTDIIVASVISGTIESDPVEKLWVASIPTLSQWGLIVMAAILGIVGFIVIRRRQLTA